MSHAKVSRPGASEQGCQTAGRPAATAAPDYKILDKMAVDTKAIQANKTIFKQVWLLQLKPIFANYTWDQTPL